MDRKQKAAQARRILDTNLSRVRKDITAPKAGWVRAIREGLGMTRGQLGNRMRSTRKGTYGLTASAIQSLERQEAAGTATLDSLQRAAEALDCTLVYALVPNRSLEETVQQQARTVAREIDDATKRTMQLEAQDYEDGTIPSANAQALIGTSALWE